MRVVIPLSGGMDSSYLVYLARYQNHDTHPIILDDSYGKIGVRDKGITPALNIMREAGLQSRIHVIPFFPTSVHKIADEKYGYTPGRNMSLALAALSYADFVTADEVWLGFAGDQEGFYSDQKQSMFDALAKLYNGTYGTRLKIALPLADMTRKDVVEEGTKLGVPFELTVSCVQTPIPVNCGVCPRCLARREAFRQAGVLDKTLYLKD